MRKLVVPILLASVLIYTGCENSDDNNSVFSGTEISTQDLNTDPQFFNFENVEFAAAAVLARKRRLGPYRDEEARKEFYEKDLAALARAGFSYDIAKQVVETETTDELEDYN